MNTLITAAIVCTFWMSVLLSELFVALIWLWKNYATLKPWKPHKHYIFVEMITGFETVTSSLPKRQGGWGLFYWCPKAHCLSVFWRFLVFDKWRIFAYDSAFLSRNMNSFWSVFTRLADASMHESILDQLLYHSIRYSSGKFKWKI